MDTLFTHYTNVDDRRIVYVIARKPDHWLCAVSICNPKDTFRKKTGRALALERLSSAETRPTAYTFRIPLRAIHFLLDGIDAGYDWESTLTTKGINHLQYGTSALETHHYKSVAIANSISSIVHSLYKHPGVSISNLLRWNATRKLAYSLLQQANLRLTWWESAAMHKHFRRLDLLNDGVK